MRLMIACSTLAALSLAGCTRTITKEVPIEVKVPVTVPCMGARPSPVQALRESLSREEWDALTTDQRANLVAAQAIERMIYGNRAADASAGCR
jgi:hypothetical protein